MVLLRLVRFMRDFFLFCTTRRMPLYASGTYEAMPLWNDWQSRAGSACYRAVKACEHGDNGSIQMAGEEWQKIFRPQMPQTL